MMLLVDTNGLRKKANEEQKFEGLACGLQPGYLKPKLLPSLDWSNTADIDHLKYQLKLEMAASTNIRPLQRLFSQTPLMPDPWYKDAGWHSVMGNLVTRFSSDPDERSLLMPAIYLEAVIKGNVKLVITRDEDEQQFDLEPGDALFFSVHQKQCRNITVKRESPVAVTMSSLYYVADERYKELPQAAAGDS